MNTKQVNTLMVKKTREQLLEAHAKELSLANKKLTAENAKLKFMYKKHITGISRLELKLREAVRKEKRQALIEKALKQELKKKSQRLEEWQYSQQ